MKKHLKKFLVLVLILPMLFVLTACGSYSAYDIALKNGFEGTEEEWLDSLKGKSAYDIAVDDGFIGTEEDWLNSLKGIDGTNGKDGNDAPEIDTFKMWEDAVNNHAFSGTYIEFLKEIVGEQNFDSSANVVSAGMLNVFRLVCQTGGSSGLSGSAVFYKYNDDGTAYLVTNYHMTSGVNARYSIYSYDNTRIITATFVGGMVNYDIAVLKIESNAANYLKACGTVDASFAEHNLGEECIAIGNTEDKGVTASKGIVSRESEEITYDDYKNVKLRAFRHDTYISHGNSGGAVFNMQGKIIGITNGGLEGTLMNYAIPANVVTGVANNVIENSERGLSAGISFGSLGLNLTANAEDTTTSYNQETGKIEVVEKVLISSIENNSLAARQNNLSTENENKFMKDDRIVSVTIFQTSQTYDITRTFNFSEALLNARIGDDLIIKLDRSGQEIEIHMHLSQAVV